MRPDSGSWIDELDNELADSIRRLMRRFTYEDGELLSPAWKPVKGVYEIYRGTVKILASSPDGRELILNVIHAGHTLNETVIIAERHLVGATTVCVGDTEVGLLSVNDFNRLRSEHPEINTHIARRLAMRNVAAYNQIIDSSLHGLELRLAFLIYTYAREDEEGINCMPFTQDDLANMTGVSRQSISRIIRGWENQGLIELGYGQLRVPDFSSLLEHAQSHQ